PAPLAEVTWPVEREAAGSSRATGTPSTLGIAIAELPYSYGQVIPGIWEWRATGSRGKLAGAARRSKRSEGDRLNPRVSTAGQAQADTAASAHGVSRYARLMGP